MAGDQIKVVISAQDSASPVFKTVADSAKSMASSLESVGTKGTSGLDAFSAKLKTMSSDLSTVGKGLTLVGGAITASLSIPLIKGTKAALDQVSAVQQATLALRVYEKDASKVDTVLQSLVKYARSDMGVLFQRQDLFAAAQGLKVMGDATEDLVAHVEIMSRSVGLGASSWDNLSEVIGRVGSTGRLTGVDFDNLTKAGFQLDNQLRNTNITYTELFAALDKGIPADALAGQATTIEGGLIRLQSAVRGLGIAFLGIDSNSQFIAGGLGDTMMNSIGQFTQLAKNAAPAAQAFGTAVGNMASVASTAASAMMLLPQSIQTALIGFTGLTGAALLTVGALALTVPKVIELAAAMRTLATAMRLGSVSTAALGVALSPVGLSLIAIGGTIAAGAYLWHEYNHQMDGVVGAYERLDAAQSTYLKNGDKDRAKAVEGAISDLRAIEKSVTEAAYRPEGGPAVPNLYAPEWEKTIDSIRVVMENSKVDIAAYTTFLDAQMKKINEDPGHAGKYLNEIMTTNTTGLAQFTTGVSAATDATGKFTSATDLSAAAHKELNKQFKDAQNFAELAGKAESELARTRAGKKPEEDINAILEKRKQLYTELGNLVAANGDKDRIKDVTAALGDANTTYEEYIQKQKEAAETTLVDTLTKITEEVEAQNKAYGDMIVTGLKWQGVEENLGKLNMAGVGNEYTQLAQNVMQANTALQSGFQVIVGNTNAIASNAQGVAAWAEKLINVKGIWGEIDQLLADKIITDTEYTNAQDAATSIFASNASIQQDILGIQAQQAPVLAELTAQQAEYVHQLGQLPAAQQLIALGWMDANEAAKANQIITTAAAAAQGDLGDAGKAATEQMIIGAANADPVLKAMLEDMKLISVGADGTITVNFDSAKNAHSEIGELTKSIDGLITQLGGIPPVHLDVDAGDAKGAVEDFITNLDNVKTMGDMISSTPIEAQINLDENGVDQTISDVSGALTQLDGKKATATVDVSFQGNAISGDGTAGDVAGIDALKIPATAKVDTVDSSALPTDTSVPVTAKVDTVDTSAIDNISDKSITVTADVSQAVIGVYNLTTQIDAISDKSTTLTVDTKLNDTTGLLAGFSTAGGGAGTLEDKSITIGVKTDVDTTEIDALNDKTATITVDVALNDPTGLLGSQSGVQGLPNTSMIRTLTVDVVAHDPEGYLGSQTGGITRTLTVDVVAHDPQSLISHAYDPSGGGVLEGLSRTLTVNVDLNDPTGLLGSPTGVVGLPDTSLMTRTITIDAVDNASETIAAVQTAIDGVDDKTVTIATMGASGATKAANDLQAAIEAIPDHTSTISLIGAESAIGNAYAVANAINNIPSDRTSYINVVTAYSSIGSPGGGGRYMRHGGIPGYASGGVIFEAGEAGREMAHFAGGGTALIPSHDYYMAPPATYISPANAVPQGGGNGGPTFVLNFNAPVYGIDDLTEKVMNLMAPAIASANQEYSRGLGVTV